MISYNQSKKILKNAKIKIGEESIKSENSLNRVAAKNIFSKTYNPAGDNAAFDGYAIDSKDTIQLNKKKSELFKIIGTVVAGDKPLKKKKTKISSY